MNEGWTLYQERGARGLWERCLGHLELTLEETTQLQANLLEDHLRQVQRSQLHQLLFRSSAPTNVREFRERVPLTTWDDYSTALGERREDLLAERPAGWMRTSGKSGEGRPKWAPFMPAVRDAVRWPMLGWMLMALADDHGQVNLRPNARVLNMLAPPPYSSGTVFKTAPEVWPLRMLPPATPEVDALPFDRRRALAFSEAVREGVDFIGSMSSVLASAGETFHARGSEVPLREKLSSPKAFARMGRAALRARIAARPMLPKDAWNVRGIGSGGMDSALFRGRIRDTWGRYPLDIFASTEGLIVAMQTWDYTTLTLVPTLNFFEFVPEYELEKQDVDPTYQPETVLLGDVEVGQNYEMVITSLHGGPMVRYRTGDVVRVAALSNSNTGVQVPQFSAYTRRADTIDLAGFTRLTEMTVWAAIERAGVPYVDWTVRKETEADRPVLHIRLELRAEHTVSEADLAARVHAALSDLDEDWANMEEMAGLVPLRVTILPAGAFDRYQQRKVAQGADLAHIKPVHMNAADDVIELLMNVAEAAKVTV